MITKDSYSLGGLLYMPVAQNSFIAKLAKGKYPYLKAFSIDLEDAMGDMDERTLYLLLKMRLSELNIYKNELSNKKVFIRTRTPKMLRKILKLPFIECVDGFILPKFDLTNIEEYKDIIKANKEFWYMPVLESGMLSIPTKRCLNLEQLHERLKSVEENILNIRVGGNDFCNLYGIRRHAPQTIYDINLISNILSDIIGVFSKDYVVSGPVCEYLSDSGMPTLRKEVQLDLLNGFIGKTAIHPKQVQCINEEMMPTYTDYMDAKTLLHWEKDTGVCKSYDGSRMLEVKCHQKWAKKILMLAEIYGVKKDKE